jgi:hypothetical protein
VTLAIAVIAAFVGWLIGGKYLGMAFAVLGAVAGHFLNDSLNKKARSDGSL